MTDKWVLKQLSFFPHHSKSHLKLENYTDSLMIISPVATKLCDLIFNLL
jgi:hypothetical protein